MAAPVNKKPDTQDVGSAVYLVDLYLPSGLYKFAIREVEVKTTPQVGGDFGSAHGVLSGDNSDFGEGGWGEGEVA